MIHEPIAEQAYQCLRNGHIEKAENCFSFLTITIPGDIHGWLGLGTTYVIQGKFDLANKMFDIAQRLDPTWFEPLAWKVETLLREGKMKDASTLLEQAAYTECRSAQEVGRLVELQAICKKGISNENN